MSDIKLTVLGSPGAGKSALIVRFLTGRYISEYASNSECVYTKQMNVDGRMTSLEIHDPCTQVSKKKLPVGEDLGRADGFLVVYDISRRSSFVFAQNLVCNLREANVRMCRRDAEAGLFLIGNKQDLCHIREVSWEEGQKTALENRCHYYELSAAEQRQEVSAMFTTIVRSIFLQNKMKDKRRPSGSMAKLISNVFGKRRKSV